jgi:hypothetical protein
MYTYEGAICVPFSDPAWGFRVRTGRARALLESGPFWKPEEIGYLNRSSTGNGTSEESFCEYARCALFEPQIYDRLGSSPKNILRFVCCSRNSDTVTEDDTTRPGGYMQET